MLLALLALRAHRGVVQVSRGLSVCMRPFRPVGGWLGNVSAPERRRVRVLVTRAWRLRQRGDLGAVQTIYRILDVTLFTWLVAYVKHPLHILALLALWIIMLASGSYVALEVLIGNYTNGVSAIAASILLMRQLHEHRRQRQRHVTTVVQNQAILRQQAALHTKLDQLHQLLGASAASPTPQSPTTLD